MRQHSFMVMEQQLQCGAQGLDHCPMSNAPLRKRVYAVAVGQESLELESPCTLQGRFPHVPPPEPVGNWDTSFGIPWWKDKKYQVGATWCVHEVGELPWRLHTQATVMRRPWQAAHGSLS